MTDQLSTFQLGALLTLAILTFICCTVILGVFLTLRRDCKRLQTLAGRSSSEPTTKTRMPRFHALRDATQGIR